jgi:hypothetical protein
MTPEQGMLLATAALVAISLVATIVNYLSVRQAVDPCVVVYTKTDSSRPRIVLLMIENVGKRTARNVTFRLSGPIPNRTAGLHGSVDPGAGAMNSGPLFSGIAALGPGASRVIVWGLVPALLQVFGEQVVTVTASFQSDPLLGIGPLTDHDVVSFLEVQSFVDGDAVDPDGARQSAKHLERIAVLLEAHFDESSH